MNTQLSRPLPARRHRQSRDGISSPIKKSRTHIGKARAGEFCKRVHVHRDRVCQAGLQQMRNTCLKRLIENSAEHDVVALVIGKRLDERVFDRVVLASDETRDLDATLRWRVAHEITTHFAVLCLKNVQHSVTAVASIAARGKRLANQIIKTWPSPF